MMLVRVGFNSKRDATTMFPSHVYYLSYNVPDDKTAKEFKEELDKEAGDNGQVISVEFYD